MLKLMGYQGRVGNRNVGKQNHMLCISWQVSGLDALFQIHIMKPDNGPKLTPYLVYIGTEMSVAPHEVPESLVVSDRSRGHDPCVSRW